VVDGGGPPLLTVEEEKVGIGFGAITDVHLVVVVVAVVVIIIINNNNNNNNNNN